MAIAVDGQVYGMQHPRVATGHQHCAKIYRLQQDYTKALESYDVCLGVYTAAYGHDSAQVASVFCDMALVYREQRDPTLALDLFGDALRIYESILPADPRTADTYMEKGHVYVDQHEYIRMMGVGVFTDDITGYTSALEMYAKALPIYEKHCANVGSSHPRTASCCFAIGHVHQQLKAHEIALESFKRALAIRAPTLGVSHVETVRAKECKELCESVLATSEEMMTRQLRGRTTVVIGWTRPRPDRQPTPASPEGSNVPRVLPDSPPFEVTEDPAGASSEQQEDHYMVQIQSNNASVSDSIVTDDTDLEPLSYHVFRSQLGLGDLDVGGWPEFVSTSTDGQVFVLYHIAAEGVWCVSGSIGDGSGSDGGESQGGSSTPSTCSRRSADVSWICILNDEICIKNDEFCITNDEFQTDVSWTKYIARPVSCFIKSEDTSTENEDSSIETMMILGRPQVPTYNERTHTEVILPAGRIL